MSKLVRTRRCLQLVCSHLSKQTRCISSLPEQQMVLYGAYGSPYTRKVHASLRYKQIPFVFHQLTPGNVAGDWEEHGLAHVKPKVIPVVKFVDKTTMNDSTKVLEQLDTQFPLRPLIPTTDVERFLCLLLEDMFDEWFVKVMFGMRWLEQRDQDWTGAWITHDLMMGRGVGLKQVRDMGKMFVDRQISRMELVGCKDPAMIKRTMRQLLGVLERHLEHGHMFMFGHCPTVADFAFYGNASQLVIDRTPDDIIRDNFPASYAWIRRSEDLSGAATEDRWEVTDLVKEMLCFAAEVYLPFLEANKKAIEAGETDVEVELWSRDSLLHRQAAFKYQLKCYDLLRKLYNELQGEDKTKCEKVLGDTGCLKFFQ